jgi:hypothetical protein
MSRDAERSVPAPIMSDVFQPDSRRFHSSAEKDTGGLGIIGWTWSKH